MALAHAHPLSDGLSFQPHASDASAGAVSPNPSLNRSPPNIHVSQRRDVEGPSPHARRLQLRNAGFRAPLLTGRRISPLLASTKTTTAAGQDLLFVGNENQPLAAEKKSNLTWGSDRLSPTSSILQEISNSSTRRPGLGRPPLNSIFQGNAPSTPYITNEGCTRKENGKMSSSPVHDVSENHAVPSGHSPVRDRTPTSTPPLKQLRIRKKSRMRLRSSSFEATKYIEHLESELASVNTRLESLNSPTSTRAHSARFRALNKQAQSLREEVSDWERKFEERVGDEVFQRTRIEGELKAQIKTLEARAETKDARLVDLEQELAVANEKLEASELLETNLERRVDVLTELLAQSPTRLNYSLNSAVGASETVKRTPRPQSMMLPRHMTSPVLISPPSRRGWQTRDFEQAGSIAETMSGNQSSPTRVESLARESRSSTSSTQSESTRFYSDYDIPIQSVPFSSSRPTSLTSNLSSWSSCGAAPPIEIAARSESKPRKMRRFKSGSTNLKPLLLPATAALPSLPSSAPVESDSESSLADYLGICINQRSAPLPRYRDGSPSPSPSKYLRKRSPRLAQAMPETESLYEEGSPVQDLAVKDEALGIPLATIPFSDPEQQNLQEELEQAAVAFGSPGNDADDIQSDRLAELETIRAHRTRSPQANPNTVLSGRSRASSPCPFVPNNSDITPKALRRNQSSRFSDGRPSHSTSTTLTPADGIMARIATLVASFKRDALISAKIILAKSWCRGSSMLGGLGWWLIGLVYGPRSRSEYLTPVSGRNANKVFNFEGRRHPRRLHHASVKRPAGSIPAMSELVQATKDDLGDLPHAHGISPANPFPVSVSSSSAFDTKTNLAIQTWTQSSYSSDPPSLGESVDRCAYCCDDPPPTRNLKLWCRFSLAIVLAIGIAIIDGPAALLEPSEKKVLSGSAHPGSGVAVQNENSNVGGDIDVDVVDNAARATEFAASLSLSIRGREEVAERLRAVSGHDPATDATIGICYCHSTGGKPPGSIDSGPRSITGNGTGRGNGPHPCADNPISADSVPTL